MDFPKGDWKTLSQPSGKGPGRATGHRVQCEEEGGAAELDSRCHGGDTSTPHPQGQVPILLSPHFQAERPGSSRKWAGLGGDKDARAPADTTHGVGPGVDCRAAPAFLGAPQHSPASTVAKPSSGYCGPFQVWAQRTAPGDGIQ